MTRTELELSRPDTERTQHGSCTYHDNVMQATFESPADVMDVSSISLLRSSLAMSDHHRRRHQLQHHDHHCHQHPHLALSLSCTGSCLSLPLDVLPCPLVSLSLSLSLCLDSFPLCLSVCLCFSLSLSLSLSISFPFSMMSVCSLPLHLSLCPFDYLSRYMPVYLVSASRSP